MRFCAGLVDEFNNRGGSMFLIKYNKYRFSKSGKMLSVGALAGLTGGLAEILWIALYSNLSGSEAAIVARGVTQSLFPQITSLSSSLLLGIAIHMVLAIILGIAILIFVRSFLPKTAPALLEPLMVIGLLVLVWTINFFVILPLINPSFVTLVPYSISLISKLLFGMSSALVFTLFNQQSRS